MGERQGDAREKEFEKRGENDFVHEENQTELVSSNTHPDTKPQYIHAFQYVLVERLFVCQQAYIFACSEGLSTSCQSYESSRNAEVAALTVYSADETLCIR